MCKILRLFVIYFDMHILSKLTVADEIKFLHFFAWQHPRYRNNEMRIETVGGPVACDTGAKVKGRWVTLSLSLSLSLSHSR